MALDYELCLFCNEIERINIKPNGEARQYKPARDLNFICSHCVILLARADQEDLKKAHAVAIDKGYTDKAYALESFIIEEEIYVSKTKKAGRGMERKRFMRPTRTSNDKGR